ncbi:MAG: pyruvate kinase [Roseiflexaceae bacterium]
MCRPTAFPQRYLMTMTEAPSHVAPQLEQLLAAVVALRSDVITNGEALLADWQPRIQRTTFHASARNLALYLALRRSDLRPLQRRLMACGLSSLGRSESHVQPSLDALVAMLSAACGSTAFERIPFPSEMSFFQGEQTLAREAVAIFGPRLHGRDTRIMVTLPPQAAQDADFAEAILRAGAECVRINCAHDTSDAWAAMIANLRQAERVVDDGRRMRVLMDLGGPKVRTLRLRKHVKQRFVIGDTLLLVRDLKAKRHTHLPCVGCTLPAVLDQLAISAEVWIDDGQIGARVTELTDDGALLTIMQAPPRGKRIRADKGLNFPDTDLAIAPLTAEDDDDLAFVVRHADMIGYSFVQSAADVALLQDALAQHLLADQPAPTLVLKIETKRAVRNLPEIIVQSAARLPTAVMIARGDLAVELGYARLAEMQEEILWLCEAAHVPVIWATQVLESLAKQGTPTRAEVSDMVLADRAECVMLNKGPYIVHAVRLLDDVLLRAQANQHKQSARLRALHSWQDLFDDAPDHPDGIAPVGEEGAKP